MKVVQLNLNHCIAAQDLLQQTVYERQFDIALLCEQYHNLNGCEWTKDASNKAAVWTLGGKVCQCRAPVDNIGFTWIKFEGIYLFSCYAPPSMDASQYERMLTELVTEARGKFPVIIAGDFNAWSTTWGSRSTNRRGRILMECLATLDVELLNDGHHTFEAGNKRSAVDLTFAHRSISRYITWSVADFYTHSDHHAIVFELRPTSRLRRITKAQTKGWKQRSFDAEVFQLIWNEVATVDDEASKMAESVTQRMSVACDAAMPRRTHTPSRRPAYWWNQDIAECRRRCNQARRKAQRARNLPTWEPLHAAYKACRLQLKKKIRGSKDSCFKNLRDSADIDPWGKAYKVVMARVRGTRAPQPSDPTLMNSVVAALFPPQGERVHYYCLPTDVRDIPAVSSEEVLMMLRKVSDNKSPGLDGIPNVAMKTAIRADPDTFARMYTACLNEGVFPDRWKWQRLVLLLKPGKQPDQPSAYRPLCMLDSMGKILESIIVHRLQETLESTGGLSAKQFGFRRGKSTIDAINAVMEIARGATSGKRWKEGDKQYCAVVTLDIKNAFNSASWSRIMQALGSFGVPAYLKRIIDNYFDDRVLLYDTDDGVKRYEVSRGVPQGSVLGPTLWNVMYNGVLLIDLPEDTTLVGYADDIALVVTAKHIHTLEVLCSDAIARVTSWLRNADLELAAHKTEAVLLSSRKVREVFSFRIGQHAIVSQPNLRYLGVLIDTRMCFKDHLLAVSEKASKVNGALSRIMANTGGPRSSRRKLLARVTSSILLYAAPVWAEATQKASYIAGIRATYRLSALRVASAFRTVSDEAIGVIAAMTPIDIVARELQRIYDAGENASKVDERRRSIEEWQKRWEATDKGRWTFTLIPNINSWISRNHGELDFHLTQLLSGHGCFKQYLHRFKYEDDPFCPNCPDEIEDARHILLYCPRFDAERANVSEAFGEPPTLTNVVRHMCDTIHKWQAMQTAAATMMTTLRRIERIRHMEHTRLQNAGANNSEPAAPST